MEAWKFYSTTNLMDDYFHNTVEKFYMNCGRNGRWKRMRPAGVLKGKLPICKKKRREKSTESQENPGTLNATFLIIIK